MTFRYILDRIEPILARQTLTEGPISPEERLAICLYRLGRGDYFYTIAEMVGRGVSTVSSIVEEVSQVLVNHLWNDCVSIHFSLACMVLHNICIERGDSIARKLDLSVDPSTQE